MVCRIDEPDTANEPGGTQGDTTGQIWTGRQKHQQGSQSFKKYRFHAVAKLLKASKALA